MATAVKMHVPVAHAHLADDVPVRVTSPEGKAYRMTVGELRDAAYVKFPGEDMAINLAATKILRDDTLSGASRRLEYMPWDRVKRVPRHSTIVKAKHLIE